MTHEVTDRHPAQALRRCATTPEDLLSASLPENEGMSAARTRFQLTPDRVRGLDEEAVCTATRCRWRQRGDGLSVSGDAPQRIEPTRATPDAVGG